ncbi:hypothetical protein Q4R72_14830, partial [Morganella morganii]
NLLNAIFNNPKVISDYFFITRFLPFYFLSDRNSRFLLVGIVANVNISQLRQTDKHLRLQYCDFSDLIFTVKIISPCDKSIAAQH